MKQDKVTEPPFRILPSRKRSLVVPVALIVIGVLLFTAAIWDGATGASESALSGFMLIAGVVLVVPCTFWLFRERRYLDPRNEYWIEIGLEEFALVTPDATDRSKWTNLSAFAVDKTTLRQSKRGGEISVYKTVARYGGLEVSIPLGDFATGLGEDEPRRAEAMCAILNEFRQNALDRRPDDSLKSYQMPAGLNIAPMAPAKRKPFIVKDSVVQRS